MAKTLRITTVLIALAALGLVILIASKGIASDKGIEQFLAAPGIAAQLQGSSANKSTDVEQDTPLVRQAKAFAFRINPPPPPEPVKTEPTPQPQDIHPQATVSAKFTLVGTSYYTGDEEHSWALIDEVGKGWHWVRQGEKIGYLVIERIGDGVVLIRDGANTYELTADRQKKPDYVKSFTGSSVSERTIPEWQGKKNTAAQAVPEEQNSVSSTETAQAEPIEDPNIAKKHAEENLNWIKQLQKNPESLGMTKEEANELGNLGEFLKTVEADANVAEPNQPNAGSKPELPKVKDVNENQQNPQFNQQSQKPQDPNQQGQNNAGARGLRRTRRTR